MLTNYQYPYEVHYLALQNQQENLKMAYMDVKPQHPNGKNVMLLHGKNFNGAYWKTTIQVLTEEGYRVIVPDQIQSDVSRDGRKTGAGKSYRPGRLETRSTVHFHR